VNGTWNSLRLGTLAVLFRPLLSEIIKKNSFVKMRVSKQLGQNFQTLHDELEEKGAMPQKNVLLLTLQLFEALSYLHSLNICHRDVKPRNLLIDPMQKLLKLCDFGSAKVMIEDEKCISYVCSRYYRQR
jgi:serine/threonine protein kinase